MVDIKTAGSDPTQERDISYEQTSSTTSIAASSESQVAQVSGEGSAVNWSIAKRVTNGNESDVDIGVNVTDGTVTVYAYNSNASSRDVDVTLSVLYN